MRTHLSICALFTSAICAMPRIAAADVPYFNGFETAGSVNDYFGPTGQAGGNITRVASGGGTLGYTAAAGGFYAEIHNTDSISGTNLGNAGYTQFGTPGAASASFGESVDIYIDTARWLPPATVGSALVITTTPNTLPNSHESLNWIFTVTAPGSISITSAVPNDGTLPPVFDSLGTVTTSGWYRLQATFTPGATHVENDVSVINSLGNTVGSAHMVSSVLPAQLIGPGSLIFGPWRDGFAADTLAIDNLQTFAVPEPMVISIFPLALTLRRRRSRR